MEKFDTVVVGGTFDEFHKGHRVLLMKAIEIGHHVLIGLCSDAFAKRLRKPHHVASYKDRMEEIKRFLKIHQVLDRVEIIPLHNQYGITLEPNHIDAIVVSRETESIAHKINDKRKAKGLSPLVIIPIEMVLAKDEILISTTRIRRKEIDREGYLLIEEKDAHD